MSRKSDIRPDPKALEEAERASRELPGQVERARRRLLRQYRRILEERPPGRAGR